jgi:hypothetical protein
LIASQLGRVARAGRPWYCAAKGALIQLAKAMALDHAGQNIRVNSLSPGPVETARYLRNFDTLDACRFRKLRPFDSRPSGESEHDRRMITIGLLFIGMLCDCFKSRSQLEAEIMVLRHQLNVLQQRAPRRPHLRWADRALFIWLYRRCPRILDTITIVRPETVLRWHRMGFAAYWRWKSRSSGGNHNSARSRRRTQ